MEADRPGLDLSAHVWMMFLREGTYMTLPAANLEEGTRAFIVDQVKLNGGRVR